jgi:5-methylthioadenosine/S-adenosylhomocysteine deaminase
MKLSLPSQSLQQSLPKEFILIASKVWSPEEPDVVKPRNLWIKDGMIAGWLDSPNERLPKFAAENYVLIPGLVNAHTHCALNFFRGLGWDSEGDKNGLSLIETVLFPAERNLEPEWIAALSYAHLIEGLFSGVTTVCDHYYFVEGVGKAAASLGMRAFIGETVADLGGAHPGEAAYERALRLIESTSLPSLVKPVIAPHAMDTVSEKLLKRLVDLAKANGLPLHMHLSQTKGERQRVFDRSRCSPVQLADACGALTERSLVVHLVTAKDEDFEILADRDVSVGYCPSSQIIYEELAPIGQFRERGLRVVLGTDCAASNDRGDLMNEMRTAALVSKLAGSKPSLGEVSTWATLNNARWLGEPLGSLRPGSHADIVFLKDDGFLNPQHKFVNSLVMSGSNQSVEHVMVAGRFALWQKQLVHLSIQEAWRQYQGACKELLKRL